MFKQSSAILGVLAVAWGLLADARPAAAVVLEFDPQDQTATLGNTAAVDVIVNDLNGVFIGAYDIIVGWDSTILSLNEVIVDPADDLGLTFNELLALTPDTSVSGSVNVADFSLELLDLTPFQNGADTVTLFSLVFDTLDVEVSDLTLLPNIGGLFFLGDELGLPVEVAQANDGSIAVVANGAIPLPAPATVTLLGAGLVGLAAVRHRRPRARRR